jgi:hypothetical protein
MTLQKRLAVERSATEKHFTLAGIRTAVAAAIASRATDESAHGRLYNSWLEGSHSEAFLSRIWVANKSVKKANRSDKSGIGTSTTVKPPGCQSCTWLLLDVHVQSMHDCI